MNFNANDVGIVRTVAGHPSENTGGTGVILLEKSKAGQFVYVSLDKGLGICPRRR